jgi:acetyl esterase/lipase
MPSFECRVTKGVIRFNQMFTLWGRASVKRQRRALDFAGKIAPRVKGVKREPCNVSGMAGQWFVPEGARTDQIILYLHGGGYFAGSVISHSGLIGRLAVAAERPALYVDYRLAPEAPFPAAVEDALESYHWLLDQGFRPENIFLAGDSAGGGLAVALMIALREAAEALPAGAVLLSPWTDLAVTGDSIRSVGRKDPFLSVAVLSKGARLYCTTTDPMHPLISPIYADLTGLPPMLIHVGTAERLFDDSVRLAERAREDGVGVDFEVWEGMFHVWHAFPRIPESKAAIQEIGQFIRQNIGASSLLTA